MFNFVRTQYPHAIVHNFKWQTRKTKLHSCSLGDLAINVKRKENAIQANQMLTLLLNESPRTVEETMANATKFIKFS